MNRPQKSSSKKGKPDTNSDTSAKAVENKAKIKARKIEKSGLTTRVRGHVSARGKRAQSKRDAR